MENFIFTETTWFGDIPHLEMHGNKMKVKCDCTWHLQWLVFLRRGARLTHFRQLEIAEGFRMHCCEYAENLILYMAIW